MAFFCLSYLQQFKYIRMVDLTQNADLSFDSLPICLGNDFIFKKGFDCYRLTSWRVGGSTYSAESTATYDSLES